MAPHTVLKLLSKKDDVIVTNISGGSLNKSVNKKTKLKLFWNLGLLAAFLGCMMEEFEGKVFVYGATNEDKYQEISNKLQLIGCLKCIYKSIWAQYVKLERLISMQTFRC